MKNKRFTGWPGVLIAVSLIAMFSCTNQETVKIGYLIPNSKAGRYLKEKEYITQKGKEIGCEVLTLCAEYDDKLQIEQAKELIRQGVKVLVVNSVNLNTAAAIVRDAHEAGVKVIGYDRMILNCDLDYYISFDNVKVGKLMADYVLKIKPEGKYFLMGGDRSDQNAVLVKKGQLDALKPAIDAKKIQIVYDVYIEDWSGENAEAELRKYLDLSQDHPDVILASYDGMATRSIIALKEYGLDGKILLTGQDAELEACRNIMRGAQAMTVYKSLKQMSYVAAEVALKLARNERITNANSTISNGFKEVPSILLDPVAVDKNNMASTVIADGLHTESDLNQ
jgi:D-xylose transport system substrate-binding protein